MNGQRKACLTERAARGGSAGARLQRAAGFPVHFAVPTAALNFGCLLEREVGAGPPPPQ